MVVSRCIQGAEEELGWLEWRWGSQKACLCDESPGGGGIREEIFQFEEALLWPRPEVVVAMGQGGYSGGKIKSTRTWPDSDVSIRQQEDVTLTHQNADL